MHITLDDEQWQAATNATLGDIFTELSERAHAKSRIVTTMLLDQRRITDRDIDAHLLQESSTQFSDLVATSATQQDILEAARGSTARYSQLVAKEGTSLADRFRSGMQDLSSLDLWLGKVADVLELMENSRPGQAADQKGTSLAAWVEELLEARSHHDMVRIADLLEYEILPRLLA
jgi:hypothetical protein